MLVYCQNNFKRFKIQGIILVWNCVCPISKNIYLSVKISIPVKVDSSKIEIMVSTAERETILCRHTNAYHVFKNLGSISTDFRD